MIQMYLVTAYLLVYSHLTQNDLHSASYTIIRSVLLLHCYYIYIYICSKGITHNHKARLLLQNNYNTHYNSNGIPPSKAILLQKDTLLSKNIIFKKDTKVKKKN